MAADGRAWDPQRVLLSVPAPLLVLDPDLLTVEASDAYLAATMTDRDAIVGRPFPGIFPEDPAEQEATGDANVRASLRRVLEHRVADVMPIQKYAIPRPESEGAGFETRYWAPVNAPVFTADGALAWIVHRADDVTAYVNDRVGHPDQAELAARLHLRTAQMEAEVFARQQLLEQNHSLQAVLDSLDTAVVGCDRDGRAILTNQSARDLFVLPNGTAPVDRWTDRFRHLAFSDTDGTTLTPDDLPIARLLRGEQVKDMVIVAKAEREAHRIFRVHSRRVEDGGRLAAVIALHDITAQRRAQRLSDCERDVADVLARPEPADHIQSYADMLLDEPDMPAADRQQMLDVIRRRTGELQALVAKLLDVAGTRAGHVTLHLSRIDLVAVARGAVRTAEAAERPVMIALDAPAEVTIVGDPERLGVVLDELLDNALTWAPDGSTIGLSVHADSHTAVMAITNTGAGISADQHQKIFDAFFRTDTTRHQGIPGFGLGLTLARAVVEQHGGSLTISEPEEATTTFTIALPTRQPGSPAVTLTDAVWLSGGRPEA